MTVLGAILAGGQSRRFGSDKANALMDGERLIDLVAGSLGPQVDTLVVCGREYPGFISLPDRPAADMGPLGGVAAALAYGASRGFDAVLCAPCDAPNLPADLRETLEGESPAVVQSQPVIGYWPCSLSADLEAFLTEGGRKLFDYANRAGARLVRYDPPIMNINRPEDMGG